MSKIIDAMLETARDLRLNTITIKEIEALNLNERQFTSEMQFYS